MRNCNVHTVHFYKPEVRAIHCMAYEPSTKKLAVSRSDDSVEIWAVARAPYVERVMHPGSVEALAWANTRLFSAGLHGSVVEFNLLELNVKHEIPMVGGPVWCIAVDSRNTMLAAGTEEGYVNLLELDDEGARPLRLLDKQEGRVLCIAWHPDGSTIATGSVDSLRLWNVATGRGTHRMTVGRDALHTETTVWCVAVTRDGTAVAGDSRGMLSFWDLGTGTQAQALVSHTAPVLALALSNDHNTVFCSGVDPVVACLSRADAGERWVRGVDRRLHEHDVRALACSGARLFSAGLDGHLAVSRYPPKIVNKYPPIPHGAVILCRAARMLLLRHLQHLELWTLGSLPADNPKGERGPGGRQLLCLRARHNEAIVCAAASADASYIAYATATTTRLVQLRFDAGRCSVLKSALACAGGALTAAFCPASPRLALAQREGSVLVLALGADRPQPIARIDLRSGAGHLLQDAVRLLSFSDCGRRLAVADLGGDVAVFCTAAWTQLAALPSRPLPALALAHRHDALAAVYADHKMVELCVSEGRISDWSMGVAESSDWLSRLGVTGHAAWDPLQPGHLLLADDAALYGLQPNGAAGGIADRPVKVGRKEAVEEISPLGSTEIVMLASYKYLAFADWLGDNELVVVETTPATLELGLPAALRQPLFGTK